MSTPIPKSAPGTAALLLALAAATQAATPAAPPAESAAADPSFPTAHAAPSSSSVPSVPSAPSAPSDQEIRSRPTPWDDLGSNMLRSVAGWPLALHAAGGLSTWYLLEAGVDGDGLRAASRQDRLASGLLTTPGLLVSSLSPILLPASLYFFADDPGWRATGAASLQAVGIAFLYNNVLKAVTGRVPPESEHPDPHALADGFRFGFLRGGLFDGWPSGHTMTNTAMAVGMAAYNRDRPWAVPAAIAYSGYVGACVVFGARGDIHWVTDATAAALMGFGVGWIVGDSYYRSRKARPGERVREDARGPRLALAPILGDRPGLQAVVRF